jgi:uncharacterized protein
LPDRLSPALALRRISSRLRAHAPFTATIVDKGWLAPFTRAPRHVVRRYSVSRPGIVRPWRIALVADLHAGSFADDLTRLGAIMAEVDAAEPDLVLLLGDYMNMIGWAGGHVAPAAIAALLRFPRARHGVFAVLGNHDWEYGFGAVREALETEGITVLENAVASVVGERLHLVGLSDDRFGAPDPSILREVPPSEPCLILAHDPASFFDVPEGALMVSGHMHGGQIRLPGLPPPLVPHGRAPRRWASGHIRERGGDLIVSAGLGCSGLPLRLFCPPEIVILELSPTA